MIADGFILFLAFKYGDEVYDFFDPDAVVEKRNCFWEEDKKTIIDNAMDNDYDFQLHQQRRLRKVEMFLEQ